MHFQGTPTRPPTDGTMLLPDTLAFHKENNADAALFLFMQDDADDLTRVSYAQFERATRRVLRAIGTNASSATRPVVAVIALADTLVYHTIVVGIMTAGFIPFPISPRNTAPAIVNLLQISLCHSVVATCVTLKDLIDDVQQELERKPETAYPLLITEAPNFLELFPELQQGRNAQDDELDILPPPKTTSRANLSDIALYLHSSGSTGLPKAIPRTHRDLIQQMSSPCLVDIPDRNMRARVAGMQLPPFHALGIVVQLYAPLFTCVSMVFFPPVVGRTNTLPVIPTPENVLHHSMRTGCNVMVTVPTFMSVWASEPTAVAALRDMELVIFSGGGLSEKLGDALVESGVVLRNIYGGTEFGSPGYSSRRPGDEIEWEYFEFSQDSEVVWVAQGDKTFECQLFTTPTHFVSVYNLPDREGFATKDLFRRHPTKEYLWKIVGRLDDVLIHSSGEKTVPPPMESIMMSSPHIMGVTMFGSKHDQAGVLIEPSPLNQIDITDAQQVAHFINLIWPVICEANQRAPAFSKIYKEMIVVTDRHKPLPRTPKGTVMRALALSAYAAEIEARYTDVASMRDAGLADPPQVWDRDCLVEWLLRQVRELCPGMDISIAKSLFDQGVDSLNAIILRRRIVGALASTATRNTQDIAHNMIYQHPTINALAMYVLELAQNHGAVAAESVSHARVQAIEDMIRKYSLPEPAPPASSDTAHASRAPVVILTGSTGHLGAHILQQLLRNPRVERVYAVNRVSPAEGRAIASRHADRFRDLGLDEQLLLSATLVHIETDTAAARLGLSDVLYEELCGRVTAVVHLAWALDFNFPLTAFEAHVRGTHHLLALARASGAKFVFASSVGAAQAWERSAGLYPEEVVLDARYAVGNGYGEGKYVAERIIATSGLDATSLRIGQISGSGNGAWAVSDWVPILVKSGLALGYLPRADGTVSWLPPHIVATCALDVVWHVGSAPAALNVVHPRGTPWDAVMAYIVDALHRTLGVRLPLVPFAEWLALLEKRAKMAGREDLEIIPGIKLLDFFRKLRDGDLAMPNEAGESEACSGPQFSTANAEVLSGALMDAPALAPSDATCWVEYWRASGFLAL